MTNPREFNPYSAPTADLDMGVQAQYPVGDLTTPSARLGAVMLDGLIYFAAFIPAMVSAGFSGLAQAGKAGSTLKVYSHFFGSGFVGIISALAILAIFIYQNYLVTTTGQTIGKRMAKIRIVKLDGSNPGFVYAVLLRSWLGAVISWIPLVGSIYGLVDALFIFRGDRRCIHDHIAGTKVVTIKAP